MLEKIPLKDCTFLIPVRIDSVERLENLIKVTEYFIINLNTNIIILEAPPRRNLLLKEALHSSIEVISVADDDPVFHRTKYINLMVKRVLTPFLAVWDADVIVSIRQIEESILKLRENIVDFVIPYDGRFLDTGTEVRKKFFQNRDFDELVGRIGIAKSLYGYNASGGGFFASRKKYIQAGLENENFYGWGIEDGERIRRWDILDLKFQRINGPMFHFTHPRGINSNFHSNESQIRSMKEHLRITKMTKVELEDEISNWKWR